MYSQLGLISVFVCVITINYTNSTLFFSDMSFVAEKLCINFIFSPFKLTSAYLLRSSPASATEDKLNSYGAVLEQN